MREWADKFESDRAARILASVERCDLDEALEAMGISEESKRLYVWPTCYPSTHWLQRTRDSKRVDGCPVLMKSARDVMRRRHGQGALLVRAFEMWTRLFRLTVVDRSAADVFCDFHQRWDEKNGGRQTRNYDWLEYRRSIKEAVVVGGRIIPMDKDRIALLERSVAVIEKLERLDRAA